MKVFTTGEVAKICNVATRTVAKWFDSGRLQGYRIPGSPDRRVPELSLVTFLHQHGMPADVLEAKSANVLVISRERSLIHGLGDEIQKFRGFQFSSLLDVSFEDGIEAATFKPDLVVVDFDIGRKSAMRVCSSRLWPTEPQPTLVAVMSRAEKSGLNGERTLFTDVFTKPFDKELLAQRIRTLIDIRNGQEKYV